MAFQPKIDLRGYNEKIKQLTKLVPGETKQVIIDEGKRLVEDLVKRTRPGGINSAGSKEKMTKKVWGNVLRTAQVGKDKKIAKDYIHIDKFYAAWRQNKKIPKAQKDRVLKARAQQFVKNQLAHRGYMAAGWLGGGNPLAAKKNVTNEIRRHKPDGAFKKNDSLTRFTITITNLVKYATGNETVQRIIHAAIEGRKKQIAKNIERILKGGKFSVLRKK